MALSGPQNLRDLPDSPPPERHRRAPGDTWDSAREDYHSGFSAPEVCERHGLGLSNFRARARSEGWRRSDQTEPELPAFEEEAAADTGPMPSFREQAEHARRAMNRFQAKGHVLQAHRWLRLYRDLIKESEREAAAERSLERRDEPLTRTTSRLKSTDKGLVDKRRQGERGVELEIAGHLGLERLDELDRPDASEPFKVHDVHDSPMSPPSTEDAAARRPGEVGCSAGHARGSKPLEVHDVHLETGSPQPERPRLWGPYGPR